MRTGPKASRIAVAGAALLAVAAGALWLRAGDEAARASSRVRPAGAPSPSAPTRSAEGASPATPLAEAAQSLVASHVSVSPRATDKELEQQFAQSMYDNAGRSVVDYLAARGLARSDSEVVVRRAFGRLAECSFDALRVESAEQAVSYDALLDAVEALLHDADGAEISALIDVRAVRVRAIPCMLNVAQQAGLPLPAVDLPTR